MYKSCVKIRGLPFEANALSIVEFFEYQIEEYCIHFVMDKPGGTKPHSGEAYVDCEDMDSLLRFHKKHMGKRYVEVLPSSKQEKAKMRSRLISMPTPDGVELDDDEEDELPDRRGNGMANRGALEGVELERVLKARGVPFEAHANEVAEVFRAFGVSEDDITIDLHQSGPRVGRPSGCAYVVFESEEMLKMARKECEGALIGTRYLELFPATSREVNGLGSVQGVDQKGGNATSIRLWGMPYSATEQDIIDFCQPEFIVDDSMIQITILNGRANGEAFIDFGDEGICDEAKQTLDRREMGGRYIEVYTSSAPGPQRGGGGGKGGGKDRSFGGKGKGAKGGGPVGRGGVPTGGHPGPRSNAGSYYGWLKLRGLPWDSQNSDVVAFFGFNFPITENDVLIQRESTGGGKATGHGFVRIQQNIVSEAIRTLHKAHIGNRYVEVHECTYEEAMKGRTGGGDSGGKGGRSAPYKGGGRY